MTHDEYEHSKLRLEEQRRSGVELVEAAYQAQIRALDLVWMLQGGVGPVAFSSGATPPAPAPPAPASAPPAERPRRRSAPEVDDDVRAAFPRLPERFTRREVCEALGYEPDRGALYRVLQMLKTEALVRIESAGEGQRATVYRKTGGAHSPSPA
ncbi:MAG TPA: hypothetical protein VLB76_13030 [Thermoanaerobaculia bacterium]|jgi:hypothetical protein|nr:hypothetical protein [Thermoanaerobaculia bacterium]